MRILKGILALFIVVASCWLVYPLIEGFAFTSAGRKTIFTALILYYFYNLFNVKK